jgi:hypothetical protein
VKGIKLAELPQFLVIGAAKSGTTSLHEYLRQHPNISLPRRKETHFFISDKKSIPCPENYKGRVLEDTIDTLEEYLKEFEVKPEAQLYGEVCPSYLFYPNAPKNIHKYIPDAKIICILRNPVDRFYSNVNYFGNNSFEFDAIVRSITNKTADQDINRFLEIGFYFKLLTRYYEVFPAKNIKVFLFEDLQKQPKKLMNELLLFIGLPEFPFALGEKFNTTGKMPFRITYKLIRSLGIARFFRKVLPAKPYQKLRVLTERLLIKQADPINLVSRKALQDIYRDDIVKLQSLIQCDLSAWLI